MSNANPWVVGIITGVAYALLNGLRERLKRIESKLDSLTKSLNRKP